MDVAEYAQKFSFNLKRLRKQRDLTQKAFADLLGYSEKTISKWECGNAVPPIETLFDIAKVLKVNLEELFQTHDVYYLGIDGGGTKTALALADKNGKVIRTRRAAPCNPVDVGFETASQILRDAIYEICDEIPLSSVVMFAGIAGGITAGMQEKFRAFFDEFHFRAFQNDSDNRNIIAAGLGNRDGMTLIMGTGICAFLQKNNQHSRVAGWGYLIDNGGSGYNLGRDALNAYFCACDKTGGETLLTAEIDAMYPGGAQNLMGYIYEGGKKAIASFAPTVFSAMEKGDKIAADILRRNMQAAAHIVETAAKEFDADVIPVILAGGVTKQESAVAMLKESLQNLRRFTMETLSGEPVDGALLLAQQLKKEGEF